MYSKTSLTINNSIATRTDIGTEMLIISMWFSFLEMRGSGYSFFYYCLKACSDKENLRAMLKIDVKKLKIKRLIPDQSLSEYVAFFAG